MTDNYRDSAQPRTEGGGLSSSPIQTGADDGDLVKEIRMVRLEVEHLRQELSQAPKVSCRSL